LSSRFPRSFSFCFDKEIRLLLVQLPREKTFFFLRKKVRTAKSSGNLLFTVFIRFREVASLIGLPLSATWASHPFSTWLIPCPGSYLVLTSFDIQTYPYKNLAWYRPVVLSLSECAALTSSEASKSLCSLIQWIPKNFFLIRTNGKQEKEIHQRVEKASR